MRWSGGNASSAKGLVSHPAPTVGRARGSRRSRQARDELITAEEIGDTWGMNRSGPFSEAGEKFDQQARNHLARTLLQECRGCIAIEKIPLERTDLVSASVRGDALWGAMAAGIERHSCGRNGRNGPLFRGAVPAVTGRCLGEQ